MIKCFPNRIPKNTNITIKNTVPHIRPCDSGILSDWFFLHRSLPNRPASINKDINFGILWSTKPKATKDKTPVAMKYIFSNLKLKNVLMD